VTPHKDTATDTSATIALGTSATSLREQVLAYIEETLVLTCQDLIGEPQFGMTPGWDSVGHMNLMIGLETRIGAELPLEDVPALTSASAIVDYLLLHSHQLAGGTPAPQSAS